MLFTLPRLPDLPADPPPIGECHLIFIRNNLLTYYDHAMVIPALTGMVEALLNGGLLIVGNSEQLPAGDFTLAQTEAYRAILRKGI